MATFDTTDISYNVARDQASWWEKVWKKNRRAKRAARLALLAKHFFYHALSREPIRRLATMWIQAGKGRDL